MFCAAATPVRADLTPDHAALAAHCRALLDEGCDGVAVLGTTGEANSFSAVERRAMLEAVVGSGIAPGKLLPGTGVASFMETVDLTRHALSLGVTTVVMLPPFYYKGVADDGLFAAYAAIVERVADPRLRVVLYHIPQFSAVPIPIPVIARLRDAFPGVFVGLKELLGRLRQHGVAGRGVPGLRRAGGRRPADAAAAAEGRRRVHHRDPQPGGVRTWPSSTATTPTPRRLRRWRRRRPAWSPGRNRVSQFAQIASIKALLAQRTGNPAWAMVRPPLLPLTANERAKL